MIQNIQKISGDWKKIVFNILFCFILIFLGFYAYLVNDTISAVVLREKIEKEISLTGTEVANLEFSYINLENSITKEFAESKGFVSILNPIFISFGGNTRALSFGKDLSE